VLQNRIYLGEIVYNQQSYGGEHEPIVDQPRWDAVQAQLAGNDAEHRNCGKTRQPSLLAGMLFDRDGNRMTPVGLHIGEVFYGNIGSDGRLDFTVVGPAVNEVARIAAMCRSVERNVLLSQTFADAMARLERGRLVSVGRYALRGRPAAGAVHPRSVLDWMSEAMMKPYVICHMVSSVDGRILPSRWWPKGIDTAGLFERLHELLGGDAWLVGRVTGQEFA
jgi:hypothetical protein